MHTEIRHTDILADTQNMETWHVLILKSEDLKHFLNKVPRITLPSQVQDKTKSPEPMLYFVFVFVVKSSSKESVLLDNGLQG